MGVVILDSVINRAPTLGSQLPLIVGVVSAFISFLKLPEVFGGLD